MKLKTWHHACQRICHGLTYCIGSITVTWKLSTVRLHKQANTTHTILVLTCVAAKTSLYMLMLSPPLAPPSQTITPNTETPNAPNMMCSFCHLHINLDGAVLLHLHLESWQWLLVHHFTHQWQLWELGAPLTLHLASGQVKGGLVSRAHNALVLHLTLQDQQQRCSSHQSESTAGFTSWAVPCSRVPN